MADNTSTDTEPASSGDTPVSIVERTALSLVELLAELGGAELLFRRDDACLAVAVVALADERRLIVVERTYRDGIQVILDPTPEELATAQDDDLWETWNSPRAKYLASAV